MVDSYVEEGVEAYNVLGVVVHQRKGVDNDVLVPVVVVEAVEQLGTPPPVGRAPPAQ